MDGQLAVGQARRGSLSSLNFTAEFDRICLVLTFFLFALLVWVVTRTHIRKLINGPSSSSSAHYHRIGGSKVKCNDH